MSTATTLNPHSTQQHSPQISDVEGKIVCGVIGAVTARLFTPLSFLEGAFYTLASSYYGTYFTTMAIEKHLTDTTTKAAQVALSLIGGIAFGMLMSHLIGVKIAFESAVILTLSPFAFYVTQGLLFSTVKNRASS